MASSVGMIMVEFEDLDWAKGVGSSNRHLIQNKISLERNMGCIQPIPIELGYEKYPAIATSLAFSNKRSNKS